MKKNKSHNARSPDFVNRNLIGFFYLLLQIDRKLNPQLYIKKPKKK